MRNMLSRWENAINCAMRMRNKSHNEINFNVEDYNNYVEKSISISLNNRTERYPLDPVQLGF